MSFHTEKWKYISEQAKDLIRKLLERDPKLRITARYKIVKFIGKDIKVCLSCIRELLEHPWIQQRSLEDVNNELNGRWHFLNRHDSNGGNQQNLSSYFDSALTLNRALSAQERSDFVWGEKSGKPRKSSRELGTKFLGKFVKWQSFDEISTLMQRRPLMTPKQLDLQSTMKFSSIDE